MKATIYHNPACGTSRKVLAALQEAGHDVQIVEYLKTPPDRKALKAILKSMGKDVRDILRKRGAPYEELGLDNPALSDEAMFDAIEKHPILIERPIVVMGKAAALCRPAETLQELIDRAG